MKLFSRITIVLLAAIISIAWFLPQEKITVYLIGDSTCANKPLDDNPERGWGQLFQNFFTSDVITGIANSG